MIELLNYIRKESCKPFHLFGSIKRSCNIYSKRHISVSFPQKSYHTKIMLCSNINVSLNFYVRVVDSQSMAFRFKINGWLQGRLGLLFEVNQMSTRTSCRLSSKK